MTKILSWCTLALLVFSSCLNVQTETLSEQDIKEIVKKELEKSEKPKDGVFVHISTDGQDAHRIAMALNMAVMMSQDKDVLVYFDLKGLNVIKKDADNIEFKDFPTSQESLQKLLDANINVLACPGCMKAAGLSKKDLMEGIRVASKEKFFNFTEGRIITFDY